MPDLITMYEGRDITTLSREDLIEALTEAAKELIRSRQMHLDSLEMCNLFRTVEEEK